MIWIVLILALNIGISWWNCYVCGRNWLEAKAASRWTYALCWCGAIQAAVGFSMPVILAVIGANEAWDFMPLAATHIALDFWYLGIIIPALGTGVAITVASWQQAYRERDLRSMGSAAYNTFAMVHNVEGAIDGIGSAFGDIFKNLSSDDEDSSGQLVVLAGLIALCALLVGAVVTASLIKHYMGTVPLPASLRQPAMSYRR